MEVTSTEVIKSPEYEGRTRLTARVVYETGPVREESYWFEVDERYGDQLSRNGNPWLACLLPLAVTVGEPLRISAPIDARLLGGAHDLMHMWERWYPSLKPVDLQTDSPVGPRAATAGRTAAFFSGGLDSFFTVLRHQSADGRKAAPRIDDLICIWGFDVPLKNKDAFDRMRRRLASVSAELGKNLVDVSTNIRTTRFNSAEWGALAHGPALISIALALESRYNEVLISSSHCSDLAPWGSHPATDYLLSTELCGIVHDGAGFDRVEKMELVAQSELAQRSLHVCWLHANDENCGACAKCYRTMGILEILGVLDRFTTFPTNSLSADDFKRILRPNEVGPPYMPGIKERAIKEGRMDFARAVDFSLKRSRMAGRWLPVLDRLSRIKGLWRVSHRVKGLLFGDAVCR